MIERGGRKERQTEGRRLIDSEGGRKEGERDRGGERNEGGREREREREREKGDFLETNRLDLEQHKKCLTGLLATTRDGSCQ